MGSTSRYKAEHGVTTFYMSRGAFDRIKRERDELQDRLGRHTREGFVEIVLGQKPVDALDRTHRCWWVNVLSKNPDVLREMERVIGKGNLCEIAHGR